MEEARRTPTMLVALAAAAFAAAAAAAAVARLGLADVDVHVDDGGCRARGPATTMKMEEQATKRLVLVLDLDHTLLHAVAVDRLTPGEARLLRPELLPCLPTTLLGGGGGGDGGHGVLQQQQQMLFRLVDTPGYIAKLRPFVRAFLREANAMYHLCICTMATRTYAHEMARLLDPEGAYFTPGHNIFTREDFAGRGGQKVLDVVRRWGDERTTVILDDTQEVWRGHGANLIRIPEYHYFADTRRVLLGPAAGPAWAELGRDEEEAEGELALHLHALRIIHREFFLDPRPGGAAAGGGVGADHAAATERRGGGRQGRLDAPSKAAGSGNTTTRHRCYMWTPAGAAAAVEARPTTRLSQTRSMLDRIVLPLCINPGPVR